MTILAPIKPHSSLPVVPIASKDFLGWTLIIFSSILLGIWAVKNTIALRNILLFLGAPLSLVYCYRQYQLIRDQQIAISPRSYLPLILITLMFFWVLFHYCFLSRFPEFQLSELRSTWLRSFVAAILGLGTGVAILRRPNALNLLWIGILLSFVYLFYQYVPKAIAAGSIFAPDYYNYIYFGKISGVLMGTILLTGLLGAFLDTVKIEKSTTLLISGVLWLIGTVIVLYSYVYIFDARNGIGIAVIIFGITLLGLMKSTLGNLISQGWSKKIIFSISICAAISLLIGLFALQQMRLNAGWSSMLEDVKTSVQIEKYPNWQDPPAMGYPKNELGQEVKMNTYERVAWATVGATILVPENPWGIGTLTNSFGQLLKSRFPDAIGVKSTHSGWLEITLAFGFPGLFLLAGSLLLMMFRSIRVDSHFRASTGLLSFGLLLTYALGELSSQHAIEILCFCIVFLGALQLLPQSALSKNHHE
jgi:hypothetical protein